MRNHTGNYAGTEVGNCIPTSEIKIGNDVIPCVVSYVFSDVVSDVVSCVVFYVVNAYTI